MPEGTPYGTILHPEFRCQIRTVTIGFGRISEEGREGKIKADPPKGRYVLVCTSFSMEIPSKVRGWWEISRRLVPVQVPVNGGLLWRPCLVSGRRWIQVPMARAVSSLCKSDLA
jgi:hypothetical protein